MRNTALSLLMGVVLVACSSSGSLGAGDDAGVVPRRDGGVPTRDGGASVDGGARADGGARPDGGEADGGGASDGGAEADGGGEPMVGDRCTASACRGNQILVCGVNGFYGPGEDCAVRNLRCLDGDCRGCQPGSRRCAGTNVVEQCNDDGLTYAQVQSCGMDSPCEGGQCVMQGPCGGGKKSNQGCDYWAVDLPNADVAPQAGGVSPATAQYAVVVSNTDETRPATITVTKSDNGQPIMVMTDTVPPRDLKVINLPARNADQCGTTMLCPNVGFKSYRIQSTIPVVAYQFNPLNNTSASFSADASLLLPTNALDTEYIVVTGDAQAGQDRQGRLASWGAFVSVVGVAEMPTMVTVTVPSGVLFDPPMGATVNGRTITATLARYQVLTVLSKPPASELSAIGTPVAGGGNLSGARVVASSKVAVFSGNVASVTPHGPAQKCCADHMEEQMFPLASWGKEYVATRSLPRKQSGTLEQDIWRITASQNGTTVAYVTNADSGLTGQPTTLSAGQSVEFRSRGDFIVNASAPVLLAQFMLSSNQVYDLGPGGTNARSCTPPATPAGRAAADQMCTNAYGSLASCKADPTLPIFGSCMPVGDPSMTLIPPLRQFRRDYVFLTPLDFNRDFAIITAPQGTTVTLDGVNLAPAGFTTVGALAGVTYTRTRIVLTTRGRHVLTASAPVGLIVGGYDQDVSYGYPGGLNLESATAADGGM